MFFRMIYDDALAQAAYLIGCQKTGEAIVIDPQRDVDRYIDIARANGLRIAAAAETHIHADFLSGTRELAEQTGATAYLSGEGGPDWSYAWLDKKSGGGSYPHRLLHDGDTFRVGGIEFRVLHAPGHTPEHICFAVTDHGGGATEPMGVVTGDFVFVGDLGRPDLLESAAGVAGVKEDAARTLHRSTRKFLELPDHWQVWPGHGAGSACGKALGAVPQSTVGYEKRFNEAIRAACDEAGFVRSILTGQPEPPLYFARMKRENKLGPAVLGGLPRPAPIGVDELISLAAQSPARASPAAWRFDAATADAESGGVALIDTRGWAQFRAGHVPGALFFPVNSSFPTDAGSMIHAGEDIYLIIRPAELETAVRMLIRVGLDRVRGWFDVARLDEYRAAGGPWTATTEISVEQARAWLSGEPPNVASRAGAAVGAKPFVLDVRRASEFAEGRIAGAVNIAHTRLAAQIEQVPRDRPLLVNCRSGARSARACAFLQRLGYAPINLAGGMLAWSESGAAVERAGIV
ncbi:MAG: MBL fold metallo-hydrolase [Phycisphaerae bacterium]|nr:MBL fold metallo-hydrolase [Phycisphaerae bacterium]